ncbi:MAG: hypothetical protein ACTHLY_21240 [Pseudolabrys sp.]
MSPHPLDLLIHLANILQLVAYSVHDILWLRWFAVASSLTAIPYYLMQPDTLWPPVFWASVSTLINLFQIARIYIERRPVVFSDDERQLYALGFGCLRPREFISLVLAGEWKNAVPGDEPLKEGECSTAVCIAISGAIDIKSHGRHLGTLPPGHVVGNALALTGSPSPVTASFMDTGRYIRWPLTNLRSFMDRRPDLRDTLQGLVNRDLAWKVERTISITPKPASS